METKSRILVVEDDRVNQLIASSLLNQWGMEATEANDGAEALEKIGTKKFQLVLMDIQMPVMDGFEATRRIRALEDMYFKNVPILAFTASGLIEVSKRAYELGMNDVVTKPFALDELRAKIEKHLPAAKRPLFINFNLYAGGDPDFKKEFITLLIENIGELQQTLFNRADNAAKVFQTVVHKVASTIVMLCDEEFSEALDEVRAIFAIGHSDEGFQLKLNRLSNLCTQVMDSLRSVSQSEEVGKAA
jgi:CheY-like chemotaxis protein